VTERDRIMLSDFTSLAKYSEVKRVAEDRKECKEEKRIAGTQPSVQSVSDVCLKRICSVNTRASSALEVLDDYCTI